MIMRAKLNYNKDDFERLRNVACQRDGPTGAHLEKLLSHSDQVVNKIIEKKIESQN